MHKRVKIECSDCNADCFIKHCSREYISLINEKKNQVVFGKGQYVFREGDPVSGIYFIQQGKVKVTSSGQRDREQIVRLAGDGHILGHRAYGRETHHINAVTLEESRICFTDNDILYNAFKANFEFLYSIMMFYSRELRKSEQRTKNFAQMTVEEKVIFALLYIIEIFGFNKKENTINASLSRQDIADIAGTNADQVSRIIAFLKKEKLVSTQGKKILIKNYEGLKKSISRYVTTSF